MRSSDRFVQFVVDIPIHDCYRSPSIALLYPAISIARER
jgi:hypothetical protein